jgi:outer membrane protein
MMMFVGMTALPLSAQVPARRVTLNEAIAMALKANPSAIAAAGSQRNAEASVRSAWGAFIPSVSLTGAAVQLSPATARVNQTTGQLQSGRWQTTEGFNASVDLFDGFQRWYGLKAAHATVEATQALVVAQQQSAALAVKQQYFAALAAIEEEVAARAQQVQAERQLAQSRARVLADAVTRSDSLRAVIQVGQAELALVIALNDRRTADIGLARLVGSSDPVTVDTTDVAINAIGVLDSVALAAEAARAPSVRAAESSLAAAEASTRISRSTYMPLLTASWNRNASGAGSEFSFVPDPLAYTGQLRIGVSLPLFNGFNREAGVVNADVARDNAIATLRDTRLAAAQTLAQALAALRTAEAQERIQSSAVLAGEEDLRVQQQRYDVGVSTMLDLLTSQSTLVQSRLALVQARFARRVARAQLEALVGHPL